MIKKRGGKKAQVTLFVIIAILIVAAVVGVYIFKDKIFQTKLPANLQPIYTSFVSCLESDLQTGADLLGTQAGYIYLPEFEAGSEYMPFSSQLNFLGNPIPYWYYVSGNGIQKEQVPGKSYMERDLERFIESKITECDFSKYYDQGFEVDINYEKVKANVDIKDNSIDLSLNVPLTITMADETAVIKNHKVSINSKLGKFYNIARKIYEYEQDKLFLEDYGIDILRLYAPVTGVEFSCSPLTWMARNVSNELQEAIEQNTQALKTEGSNYILRQKENKYFVVSVDSDGEKVNFLNSRYWPYSFEVEPSEGELLIAQPVGNQPGLGILGFCYVPYHFVYNLNYPVLVQIYNENSGELFQFPIAVVIRGNKPREPLKGSAVGMELPELCNYKNNFVSVSVSDTSLNPVNADISFECFSTKCYIGKTENGYLREKFPQCVNGFIIAQAKEGSYEDGKYLISTNTENSDAQIILDKLYEIPIDLRLNNKPYNEKAIIYFTKEDGKTKAVAYPQQRTVLLSEGQYEISVYIYSSSNLKLQGFTKEQCIEVPKGFFGLFGVKKKECHEIKIPEQLVSSALSGGGKTKYYILESELQNSNVIEINAPSLPIPRTLEDLQNNYNLFEEKNLDIIFR